MKSEKRDDRNKRRWFGINKSKDDGKSSFNGPRFSQPSFSDRRIGWARFGEDRDIMDLYSAERLIIWMMRCFHQGPPGVGTVKNQISAMMPREDVVMMLDAALRVHSRLSNPPGGNIPSRIVTPDEERLISFFYTIQVNSGVHGALAGKLFMPQAMSVVHKDAIQITEILSANGLAIPMPPDMEPPCWRAGKQLAPVNLTARLASAERVILRAHRLYALSVESRTSPRETLERLFLSHGLNPIDASASIDLFETLEDLGTPILEVCGPDCPNVRDAERKMLNLIMHSDTPVMEDGETFPQSSHPNIQTIASFLLSALRNAGLATPMRFSGQAEWIAPRLPRPN